MEPDEIDAYLDAIMNGTATAQPVATSAGAPAQQSSGPADESILQSLIAAHGDVIGTSPVDPFIEVDNPEYISGVGMNAKIRQPNPNPSYKYVFADGTSAVAQLQGNRWEIVDPGTAIGPKAPKETRPSAPTTREDPQGNLQQYDPDRDIWRAATGFPQVQTKPETITDDDGNIWKKEPVSGNYINIGNIPLTESQRLDRAYKSAQIANLGAGNALAKDKFAWEQAKEIENRRHEIEKQRQADEAAMERQRLAEQANVFDTVTKNWRELLPRRIPQGMEYWPGAEPEGPLSVLYKQAGAQYNPVAGRVVPTSYNDEDMWKKALGMVGGKQNG